MSIYAPSRIARYNSQKHTAPVDKRARARVTKRGPAAPVTLSPHRSTVLKHLKTHFEQIIAASKTHGGAACAVLRAEQSLLTLIDLMID